MTIVRKALDATIIHHTGTFIRFHKTDVAQLPSNERACDIELPDGRVVRGKFAANRDLLNINGRDLVRWIKSWLPETQSAKVTIHPVGTADRIRIELSGKSGFPSVRARNGVMAKSPKVKGLDPGTQASRVRTVGARPWPPSGGPCRLGAEMPGEGLPRRRCHRRQDNREPARRRSPSTVGQRQRRRLASQPHRALFDAPRTDSSRKERVAQDERNRAIRS